eukprot:2294450-Pyramimonas_sp.AAC.1
MPSRAHGEEQRGSDILPPARDPQVGVLRRPLGAIAPAQAREGCQGRIPPKAATGLNPWSKEAKELEMRKVEQLEAAQAKPQVRRGAAAVEQEGIDMDAEATDEFARHRLQELDKELVA